MTPFTQSVVEFTQRRDLIQKEARVMVALSGGPDSCALLLSLIEAAETGLLSRPIAAAHFHHGVRGVDADQDAAFCAALCTQVGLSCIIGLGAVPKVNGGYSSATARTLRYDFLKESAEDCGADILVTAHTYDDQAETVLGRVLRGTSVDGVAGIPLRRILSENLTVVRPLLGQRRADIEAYCASLGLSPRHDPSNDKLRYTRTRLRKLLPQLTQSFNPQVYRALNRLAENAAMDADLLASLAHELWTKACVNEVTDNLVFDIGVLRHAHPALRRRVLLRAIRRMTPEESAEESATSEWVDRIERLTEGQGTLILPGTIQVSSSENRLSFRPFHVCEQPVGFCLSLPVPGKIEIPEGKGMMETEVREGKLPRNHQRRALCIDMNRAIGQFPLVVRTPEIGERFAPLGMKGKTRLIRDILADSKIPRTERDIYPLVAREDTGEVLWIIGIAQAEVTRVDDDTESVLRFTAHFDRTYVTNHTANIALTDNRNDSKLC